MVLEMSNFSVSVGYVSREGGRSPAKAVGYIFRQKIRDNYYGLTYDYRKKDVQYKEIFLTPTAPLELRIPQVLADIVDAAEKRCDARTLRTMRAALPNELPLDEHIEMVREYVADNFVSQGMCAVVAIHEGKNADPSKNNPHVHILLTTREATPDGFSPKKNREWDKRANVTLWRKQWAAIQNRAYERAGLKERVSHESYAVQGIGKKPRKYLNRLDYGLERRGIHTERGDKNRLIEARNKKQKMKRQRNQGLSR
jgi:ATP-dependent exoDNAse (exonuclease V) alpha subunit